MPNSFPHHGTTLLDRDFDAWDNFYITLSPEGYIQMSDLSLPHSGDSYQAFDTQNNLSTRTERGAAWLDHQASITKAKQRAKYIKKGYPKHRKPYKKQKHHQTSQQISATI